MGELGEKTIDQRSAAGLMCACICVVSLYAKAFTDTCVLVVCMGKAVLSMAGIIAFRIIAGEVQNSFVIVMIRLECEKH